MNAAEEQLTQPDRRWIAQLEVAAELVLPDGSPPVTYTDPQSGFLVRLTNRTVRPLSEEPLLEMQLEFDAPNLETAYELAAPIARQFTRWLCFVTHSSFRVRRVERVIDWTPGLDIREQYICHQDLSTMPEPALEQKLSDTIALFNAVDAPPEVERAIRWFANGVAAELSDDQFQCFFFALEILAQLNKSTTLVPDRCQKCDGELYCEKCAEVSTHRPFAKQAIEQLILKIDPKSGATAFRTFYSVRNQLMHGRQVDEIEVESDKTIEEIVDRAGLFAWAAIFNALPKPSGTYRPHFIQASTFAHRTLNLRVHAKMGAKSGDKNKPKLEDQGTMSFSVEVRDPSESAGPAKGAAETAISATEK